MDGVDERAEGTLRQSREQRGSEIEGKLQQDSSIDGILSLGGDMSGAAVAAVESTGSTAKIGTFDVNADVVQNIIDGKIVFAIDQQPYVQGYMAVSSLYLYLKNGNDIGGGKPVLTGPSFVDKTNIATILPFTKKNTR